MNREELNELAHELELVAPYWGLPSKALIGLIDRASSALRAQAAQMAPQEAATEGALRDRVMQMDEELYAHRTALEIIALDDAGPDPVQAARQHLVSCGHWRAEAVADGDEVSSAGEPALPAYHFEHTLRAAAAAPQAQEDATEYEFEVWTRDECYAQGSGSHLADVLREANHYAAQAADDAAVVRVYARREIKLDALSTSATAHSKEPEQPVKDWPVDEEDDGDASWFHDADMGAR